VRETFTEIIGPELPVTFKEMTFQHWLKTTKANR